MKNNLISLLIPISKNLAHLLLIIGLLFIFQSSAFAQEATSEKSSPRTKEAKVWHFSLHRSIELFSDYKTLPYDEDPSYTYEPSKGKCWNLDFKYFFNKTIGLGFKGMIYSYDDVVIKRKQFETNYHKYYDLFFFAPELSLKEPLGRKFLAYGDITMGRGIFNDFYETYFFQGYSLSGGLDYFFSKDIALSFQTGYFGIVKSSLQPAPYQSNISSLSLGLKITPSFKKKDQTKKSPFEIERAF